MSTGTYEEALPCGGKLKVTKTSWEISYYFSGPDMRYNGTFISIPGNSIEKYITAFRENFAEYIDLKSTIPSGGEFSKQGKMGMSIRVGKFNQGVCLQSYFMPIDSKQKLEQLLDDYGYASKRAPQIQQFLSSL
jgi:hypothetical protein